jgi:uncharacterized protein YciI
LFPAVGIGLRGQDSMAAPSAWETVVRRAIGTVVLAVWGLAWPDAHAQTSAVAEPPAFDEALARQVGADEYGMRHYVHVVLKTGPTPVAAGPERDEMFRGHFANIKRLAAEGLLVHAGPFDGVAGWRGLYIFAVPDIEQVKSLVATDPVIAKGEMVAEYHKHYGSAALMLVREAHDRISKKKF